MLADSEDGQNNHLEKNELNVAYLYMLPPIREKRANHIPPMYRAANIKRKAHPSTTISPIKLEHELANKMQESKKKLHLYGWPTV